MATVAKPATECCSTDTSTSAEDKTTVTGSGTTGVESIQEKKEDEKREEKKDGAKEEEKKEEDIILDTTVHGVFSMTREVRLRSKKFNPSVILQFDAYRVVLLRLSILYGMLSQCSRPNGSIPYDEIVGEFAGTSE
ncbi:hypothetical protein Clacol_004237 [Clathrus columnatus]|uniref:Uncharacterized protein n=1 Tax=Clathrus columnatus TaxID=1419009 RepID=A0AAV5AC01_9AGAM|nr:hypothetical protein Clacol_004237 [Clathrus columnatus]